MIKSVVSHGMSAVFSRIVSDDILAIQGAIKEVSSDPRVNLILTSGGTGFGPRDVTPEAVEALVSRRADSLTQYMITEACKITPMACLSRAVIGTIHSGNRDVILVTLPGKPKAVIENMDILMRNGVLKHAVKQTMNGDKH